MAQLAFVTCLLVCALAVFVMWPAPELSKNILEWKRSGNTFMHNGYNVFYHDVKGSGPAADVLVLFHGYPTSTYDFIEVWDGLLERYGRVIAPDFLGFGLSDKPVGYEYSVMDMADMIGSLLVDRKVDSFHILAHDLGDTVAQEIVARYNEGKFEPKLTLKSVCLLNGGILPEHHQKRLVQKLLLNPYAAPVVMRLMNMFTFQKALGECIGDETQPSDADYRDHWALLRYNDGHLVHHGLIQYITQRFANRDRWVTALSDTKLPLHLIYGASDPVNTPDTFLKSYKKLIPNSGITELPVHIGHYPHLEDPQGTMRGYLGFLDSLEEAEKARIVPVEEIDPPTQKEEVKGKTESMTAEKEAIKEKTEKTDHTPDEEGHGGKKDVDAGDQEEIKSHPQDEEDGEIEDDDDVEEEQKGQEVKEQIKKKIIEKLEPLEIKLEKKVVDHVEELKPNDDVLVVKSENREAREEHTAHGGKKTDENSEPLETKTENRPVGEEQREKAVTSEKVEEKKEQPAGEQTEKKPDEKSEPLETKTEKRPVGEEEREKAVKPETVEENEHPAGEQTKKKPDEKSESLKEDKP